MALKTTHPVLGTRALNRATLDRQLLLRRSALGAEEAVARLLGLQAQNTKPPYYALAARLDGFRPEDLSTLMESRAVARIVTLRSTVHTHTARDAVALRGLAQKGAIDRELAMFVARGGLDGVDLDRVAARSRALVEERPRTPKQLREELLKEWPDADPLALTIAFRCRLPLVQVTPRGLWGRAGQVALTTTDAWFDRVPPEAADVDETVLRYLGAFGPASVKDMQTWSGLTGLKEAFERLRPRLALFRSERGTELFDLPDGSRPDEDTPAPPRFLPEFDNLLLSHADRSRVVSADHRSRTWKGNQAYRVFLLDGFVAGRWHLAETKERVTMTIEPFEPLPSGASGRRQRAELLAEAERTLAVLGTEGVPYEIGFAAPEL
ncbi:winged helix DNA-binding domain-containing protein [Streptomyces sp. NPDC051180]|uniref:winged helix DNA-binding domain-containing protein n=1 Tax=unclassified Streptomyces TaxID=2593676 RepID=UPI00344B6CAE